ncbi:MAG: hypothetical protein A2848_00155 [Candidatus Magasanikbacteria bacterium RIFCSPHIGHO2_01_FULL_50_8]|uniref:Thioredoxin domain-containing protein n=2 Tax=Candidatus Magasanikiibacteriota TaxID=1752731 RepID=A0A1F6LVZ4_9BACT|nr:MAG: hypothetical protein A2848_00155 [Candidatus Magasanikbacteria bacterium RIFCSPHIGHO2_01_FULL_50_8]OGH67776.1 MAG: hypothetical protein A3C15_02865 [Candidatus Magasanikbacteria bacterium RIFCSPHIGHO2_02_FULL_50_9b]
MKDAQGSNKFLYGIIGLIVVVIGALAFVRSRPKQTPPGAQQLAQCLVDKGVAFYGASWCSHCKSQKELFGGAAATLPYIECAIGNGQSQECTDAGVESYPTWVNAKKEKLLGEQSFAALAEFSGCELKP